MVLDFIAVENIGGKTHDVFLRKCIC